MQELFNLQTKEDGTIAVSGRELHKGLEIETPYKQWLNRMIAYGFEENTDYILVTQKSLTNNPRNPYTNQTDHIMTLDMAKEIAMIQRSEIGKQVRKYFIEVEKDYKEQHQVPQTPMQALEMMFNVQKEQQEFNKRIETEVTGIRNIVGIETKNWRNDTNKVLGAIAQQLGGGQKHKEVRTEAYKILEEKGRCKLEQRLNNRKAKMLAKGATKTQINKLSKLDVINDDPRLIEIYISGIKSMAIKYGVDTEQFEL